MFNQIITDAAYCKTINIQNCLFDGNEVNLIDYGESELFKTGEIYDDFIYPEFVLKSNVVNLEHNGIPDCIQSWAQKGQDIKQCFIDYLNTKGEYYREHAEFLKSQNLKLENSIDYEENYAKVLENPSDYVIENEIRRIDCLYTFELADTAVNYKHNPKGARTNWKLALEKSQKQLAFIDKTLKGSNLSNDERKYFEYQRKIISLFEKQFTSWGNSTIEWLNSLAHKKDLSEDELKFIRNKNKSMVLPPDLTRIVL